MKEGQTLWTREQLTLAINLYCKMEFGKMHARNPDVIKLSKMVGRSANAAALKLVNFASLDPALRARGIKGQTNAGSLTETVWNEFFSDWDNKYIESEKLLAKYENTTIEKLNDIDEKDLLKIGKDVKRHVNTRLNQSLFRRIMLSNYNNKCCITGIDNKELLVASHILPWSKDEGNRLNPMNGLIFNTLHDKAFETGLITITEDYKLKVSPKLKDKSDNKSIKNNFLNLDGKEIFLPKKFKPSIEFLSIHFKERFLR